MPHTEQLKPEEQIEAIAEEDFKTLCDRIEKGQISLTTALHNIVNYTKHNSLLEWILKKYPEVDVNAKNSTDSTPLIMAANLPNFKAMEMLINHGADIEVINVNGRTARDVLVSKKLSNQVAWFDQTVKAYQDKKNYNQSLQDKKESLSDKSKSSKGVFSFLDSLSKKDEQAVPLIQKKTQ